MILNITLYDVSGDYGKGPKCGTTFHTVYTTVKDTFFEKSCSKVSDRQCKTVFDTSYEGAIETQCKPEYVSKCKHVYKTGYKGGFQKKMKNNAIFHWDSYQPINPPP